MIYQMVRNKDITFVSLAAFRRYVKRWNWHITIRYENGRVLMDGWRCVS